MKKTVPGEERRLKERGRAIGGDGIGDGGWDGGRCI